MTARIYSPLVRIVPFLLVACLLNLPAQARYSGGSGTADDPYQIAAAADLIALGETPADYDKHFVLTADIDLDPNLPGGRVFDRGVIDWLNGVFDGNGYTILHLTIKGKEYLGLFGHLTPRAQVMNLGIVDVSITGADSYCGGLVGRNLGANVADCYSTAAVTGQNEVGGLIGTYDYESVGEWVREYRGRIVRCHSTGAVTGAGTAVGGLIGGLWGDVTQCYSTGAVWGHGNCVGGLVGENRGDRSRVNQCYSTGAIHGDEGHVGGLVGWNNAGRVAQCYSSGAVGGKYNVGGLVGYNGTGSVTHSYSTGAVSATTAYVGGLIGNPGQGVATNCFWDTQTSGQMTSAAGIGKTTAEMQDARTYLEAGWDWVGEAANGTHETWLIPPGGGYPNLAILSGYVPPALKGLGTADDPYQISDASELGAMVHYDPQAHYRLVATIDLSDTRWGMAPVPSFSGMFDGSGLAISHLTITGGDRLGLFGELAAGAEVRNLAVVDANVVGSGSFIGGLAGENNLGHVTQCSSTGTVRGDQSAGGLVGSNSGNVTDCYSTCAVSGTSRIGGLLGDNWGRHPVTRCYSTGAVRGTGQYIGGLLGSGGSKLDTTFWDMQTSGQTKSPGGAGLTTAEMQRAATYLDAGWDFVGETANGTEDIWWIDEGKDYPRLWWEPRN